MKNFTKANIYSDAPLAAKAAELFSYELEVRGVPAKAVSDCNEADFSFVTDKNMGRDSFSIKTGNGGYVFTASGIRGHIYAFGYFLRKAEKKADGLGLVCDVCGDYSPYKKIRGHQLGYRTTPNTYDAWDYEQYRRYYIDLMMFGMNTVEHIPYQNGFSERNRLMKYDEEDFLVEASRMADEYDLDVSIWHPNNNHETFEEAVDKRDKLYRRIPRLDYVFIPGGDPGDLPAEEMLDRCIAFKKVLVKSHPDCQMWPSAQAPHSIENWGEKFAEKMKELPEEIDGVIYGPNHAFSLEELREKIDDRYPLRNYPDLTHNVRCEYPVHYRSQDWDFALCSCLSRESTNPRPVEYSTLFKETESYFIGSVSYSEGIHDDVNKVVWSCLDYDGDYGTEGVYDYSRTFFYGYDWKEIAEGIFDFEKSWNGSVETNAYIEKNFNRFTSIAEKNPELIQNWRFLQLLIRARCDRFIQLKRLDDIEHISTARKLAESGDFAGSRKELEAAYPDELKAIREDIFEGYDLLFNLIGYQADVEHYCTNGWERGAVLDTIDNPVSDRPWLLDRFSAGLTEDEILRCFARYDVKPGDYYYSNAFKGLKGSGFEQEYEVYMNFRGDNPGDNNGTLPTGMFCIFDSYTFRTMIDGLEDGCGYRLHVTWLRKFDENAKDLEIKGNGYVIYHGPQYGTPDPEFDRVLGNPKGCSCVYDIPAGVIKDGKLELLFSEFVMCVMFAEFYLEKTE